MKELLNISRKLSDGKNTSWFSRSVYIQNKDGDIFRTSQLFNVAKRTENYDSSIIPLKEFEFDALIHYAIYTYNHMFYSEESAQDLYEYKYCTITDDYITLNFKRIDSEYNGNSMTETYLDYRGGLVKIEINTDIFNIPELKKNLKCLDTDVKIYEGEKVSRAVEFTYKGNKTILKELEKE